jgi:hypothetical protein
MTVMCSVCRKREGTKSAVLCNECRNAHAWSATPPPKLPTPSAMLAKMEQTR